MELFQNLGLNSTFVIQFIVFALTITFLYRLVFVPYSKALEGRGEATIGSEQGALELVESSKELMRDFEAQAKDVNSKIKTIYDAYRAEAQAEQQRLLLAARSESELKINSIREKIKSQILMIRVSLQSEAKTIATQVVEKVIGRGV